MLKKVRRFPSLARKALREGLGWSETPPSSWSKKAVHYPLNEVYRFGKRVISHPRVCVYITEGTTASGNHPLKVAFVGAWQIDGEPAMERYEQYLFQPGSAVRKEGQALNGDIRQQAERLAGEVDLVLAAGAEGGLWKPSQGSWVLGPAALRRTYDFQPGEPWTDFLARLEKESSIARVRDSGLRYAISRRYTDFSLFLEQMYLPHAQFQKDGYGERLSAAAAREQFEEHRDLLLVEDPNGQILAGAFMYPWHKVMRTCLRGVVSADGSLPAGSPLLTDRLPPPELAQAAIDYFGLKWAFDSGCKRYDAGLGLPFLTDSRGGMVENSVGWLRKDLFRLDQVLLWAPAEKSAGLAWLMTHPMEPRYTQVGGSDLQAVYESLRGQPASPASLRAAIPNTAAPSPTKQMEDYRFTIQGRATPEDVRVVNHGLFDHALEAIGSEWGRKYHPFSILVHNQQGKVVGGLLGRITWNYMHIDSLWVSEELRGQHIGSRLMAQAEREARAEQVKVMLLETTSFEARSFYPRLGFEEVAAFEGVPPGHIFYIMKKVLY